MNKKVRRILVVSGIVLAIVASSFAGITPQADAATYVHHSVHIDANAVRRTWANPVFVGYSSVNGYNPGDIYSYDWFISTYVSVTSRGGITSMVTDFDYTGDSDYIGTSSSVSYQTLSGDHRRVTWIFKKFSHSTKIYEPGIGYITARYYDYLSVRIDAYSIPYDAGFSVYAYTWTQIG